MIDPKAYELLLDGPLFRRQRSLLARIAEAARRQQTYAPGPGDAALLEGLLALTDELADQAHDRHGIDCLLAPSAGAVSSAGDDNRCECEQPGYFRSGVPGILAHVTKKGRLAKGAKVERCDLCQRYPSDEAAFERLRQLGLVQP